jgi:hypothetical protein
MTTSTEHDKSGNHELVQNVISELKVENNWAKLTFDKSRIKVVDSSYKFDRSRTYYSR